jgi:hypothetical protein
MPKFGEAEERGTGMNDSFLGVWLLIPELSIYQVGEPPASGRYEISANGDRLEFAVRWTSQANGPEQTTAFGGPADGSAITLPVPAGVSAPDTFTITRIDAQTLDSAALMQGETVSYARRRVSDDGSLMSVVQETHLPDGRIVRNFQVYRRA